MGGRNTRPKVLRVRYKDGDGFRSRLFIISSRKKNKQILRGLARGRVLRIGKVSKEQLLHIGEFNKKPQELMKELRGNGKVHKMKSIAQSED